jgi:hypothetical protein
MTAMLVFSFRRLELAYLLQGISPSVEPSQAITVPD